MIIVRHCDRAQVDSSMLTPFIPALTLKRADSTLKARAILLFVSYCCYSCWPVVIGYEILAIGYQPSDIGGIGHEIRYEGTQTRT